ncbi:hypothetical protein, partial [Bradyrhizobium sp.]|uniref:hypothetical protein n=1 Tax=Bradyrhizobium sp. TaxID=376 RepID=UPI001EC0736B
MEEIIAGGILLAIAKLAIAMLMIRLVWASLEYAFDHPWILWTLVGLAGAAIYLTYGNRWGYVADNAASAFGVTVVLILFAGMLFYFWELAQKVWRFGKRMIMRYQ